MQAIVTRLADFCYKATFESIPTKVIQHAKKVLLDFVGAAIGGSRSDIAKTLFSSPIFFDGNESTVLAYSKKSSCENAAFLNASMASVLELDEGHRYAMGHPGLHVIPAALAVAERESSSGKELLTAIIVGYDVAARLGSTVNPSMTQRGFHTHGTWGTVGAAVAAAKLLNLSADAIGEAISIAANFGITATFEAALSGQSVRNLFSGMGARNGVFSALLAELGITGPKRIFESDKGYCRTVSDKFDLNKLTQSLGESYEITRNYFKLHASCRYTHSAIDAALAIRAKYQIDWEKEVKEITVRTYSLAAILNEKKPTTELAAKFSIPYTVAKALLYGKVGPEEFSADSLRDEKTLKLAEKTIVVTDEDMERRYPTKRPASVLVKLYSGEVLSHSVDMPRGDPEEPYSDQEIQQKFLKLVSPILGEIRAKEIVKNVLKVDHIQSIHKFTEMLRI